MSIHISHPTKTELDEKWRSKMQDVVHSCASDFVPWSEYESDNQYGVDLSFFDNYKSERCFIAVSDGDCIGFLCYDVDSDRTDIPVEGAFIYISLMMVHPQYRGRGVGKMLYNAFFNQLDVHDTMPVVLGTWESNDAQKHILPKYGFEVFHRKENHRVGGSDTLLFRRD